MVSVKKLTNYNEVGANSCTNFTGIKVDNNGIITYISCPFRVEKVGSVVRVVGTFGESTSFSDSDYSYVNMLAKANSCNEKLEVKIVEKTVVVGADTDNLPIPEGFEDYFIVTVNGIVQEKHPDLHLQDTVSIPPSLVFNSEYGLNAGDVVIFKKIEI